MIDKEERLTKRLSKIFEKIAVLYSMRPTIYYYVPPCPQCGSRLTGRYVKQPYTKTDIRYVKNESLRHGELIRMTNSVPISNAFCEECGHEWPEHIYARILPAWQVENEKKARSTDARYNEFQITDPKKRPFWRRFTGFFS